MCFHKPLNSVCLQLLHVEIHIGNAGGGESELDPLQQNANALDVNHAMTPNWTEPTEEFRCGTKKKQRNCRYMLATKLVVPTNPKSHTSKSY